MNRSHPKRCQLLLSMLTAWMVSFTVHAATVIWPVTDIVGTPQALLPTALASPSSPNNNGAGGYTLTNLIFKFKTDVNGIVTYTNLFPGTYVAVAQGAFGYTAIQFTVTNFSSTNYITNVATVSTVSQGLSNSYPMLVSDARYPSVAGSNISLVFTNGQLTINASGGGGGLSGFTNTAGAGIIIVTNSPTSVTISTNGGGAVPIGSAGGLLTGTYPNPTLNGAASLPAAQITGTVATNNLTVNANYLTNLQVGSISNNASLVPPGANYGNGTEYDLTVIANRTYYYFSPNQSDGSHYAYDPVSGNFTSGGPVYVTGTTLQLIDAVANEVVSEIVTGGQSGSNSYGGNFTGQLSGQFGGVVIPGSYVPDGVLSNDVVFNYQQLFQSSPSGAGEHFLITTNTGNGSTFSIVKVGPNGYVDMNFETATTSNALALGRVIQFAIGKSAPGATVNFAYSNNYVEVVNGLSFYFVNSGAIYGGVRGAKFNLVWYQDGTTNTPMFEIDRASGTITNYSPVVFQKAPTLVLTNAAPGNTTTPKLWTPVTNGGVQFLMPLYQ